MWRLNSDSSNGKTKFWKLKLSWQLCSCLLKTLFVVGPLTACTILEVEPHWTSCSKLFVGGYKADRPGSPIKGRKDDSEQFWRKSCSNIAGHEFHGTPLNILMCNEVKLPGDDDYTQLIGTGAAGMASQYWHLRSGLWIGSKHTDFFLDNLDQFEWVSVTQRTIQQCAKVKGVQLALQLERHLYACRINFYGWEFSESDGEMGAAKLAQAKDGSVCTILPGSYEFGHSRPIFCYGGSFNSTLDEETKFELLCYRTLWQSLREQVRCIEIQCCLSRSLLCWSDFVTCGAVWTWCRPPVL